MVQFSLSNLRKRQRAVPLFQGRVKYLNNELLCPVRCLGAYIGRSEKFRDDIESNSLFLSVRAPFRPVKAPTIAKWI